MSSPYDVSTAEDVMLNRRRFVDATGKTWTEAAILTAVDGYRASSETPNRKPPQGGSGTAPPQRVDLDPARLFALLEKIHEDLTWIHGILDSRLSTPR